MSHFDSILSAQEPTVGETGACRECGVTLWPDETEVCDTCVYESTISEPDTEPCMAKALGYTEEF